MIFDSFLGQRKGASGFNQPGKTPVYTANQLLEFPEFKDTLLRISQLIDQMPGFSYKEWLQPAIHQLAEFLQSLPETRFSYYFENRGALLISLERALTSARLCYKLLQSAHKLEASSERFHLWIYVLFTASMFHRLGSLTLKTEVTLYKSDTSLGRWHPLHGTMRSAGATHYRHAFVEENFEYLALKLTPLLARQILPKEGFDRIAENPEVFGVWLALLQEEWEQVGSFSNLIPISQSTIVYEFFLKMNEGDFHQHRKDREQANVRAEQLSKYGLMDDTLLSQAGFEFLKWLHEAVESGQIHTHSKDAHVHLFEDSEHALVDHEHLVKEYVKHHPKGADAKTIIKSLVKMDVLVKNSKGGFVHTIQTVTKGGEVKMLKGIVLQSSYYLMSPETARERANNPLLMQYLCKVSIGQVRPTHQYEVQDRAPVHHAEASNEPAPAPPPTPSTTPGSGNQGGGRL